MQSRPPAAPPRRARLALAVLWWLPFSAAPLPAQGWVRWLGRFDEVDLRSYFPEEARTLTDPEGFRPGLTQDLIAGPVTQGVLDWAWTVRLEVRESDVVFRSPARLPALFAGLRHQAILVEVGGEEAPRAVYPALQQARFEDSVPVAVEFRPGLTMLYLIQLEGVPEGSHRLDLQVREAGRTRGTLGVELHALPSASLHVRLEGPEGEPTSARVGAYSGERDEYFEYPDTALALPVFHTEARFRFVGDATWPSPNPLAFHASGEFELAVRPGPQRLLARKGTEFLLAEETLVLEPGERKAVTLALRRWIDRPAEGWYSGDLHVHVPRDGSNDALLMEWARAEDVHVTSTAQMGDQQGVYFPQHSWQDAGTFQVGTYLLRPGQEFPRSPERGHALMLNNGACHRDPERYFLFEELFDRARAEGGLAGYAHAGHEYHVERSLAIAVPLGRCDFLEVFAGGQLDTSTLYHWWNLGFRQTPVGGSDFPFGRQRMLGDSPVFVHVDGPFSYDRWQEGLARGGTYVSSGPHVDLTVADLLPGETLALAAAATVPVRVRARLNPTLDQLATVEIVSQGRVLHRAVPTGAEAQDFTLAMDLALEESCWLAVRVEGQRTVAHTGAVYVEIAGRSFADAGQRSALARASLGHLRDLERWAAEKPLPPPQREELGTWIARARAVLEKLAAP